VDHRRKDRYRALMTGIPVDTGARLVLRADRSSEASFWRACSRLT
jgi:hypothetical protein